MGNIIFRFSLCISFCISVSITSYAYRLESTNEIRQSFFSFGTYPLSYEVHPVDSKEVIQLGRRLFFDTLLSGNRDISCAHCHHPHHGSVDNIPVSIGTGGQMMAKHRRLGKGRFIPRNAPGLFNMGSYSFTTTMWDGRIRWGGHSRSIHSPEPAINGPFPQRTDITDQLTTLAAVQTLFPITSHDEMRGQKGENELADASSNLELWDRVMKRLLGTERFRHFFSKAYPQTSLRQLNIGHMARAIGAYEVYTFRASATPFDKFMEGNDNALTSSQLKGAQLFLGKGQCIQCHSGPHLTDFSFHSIGAPQLGPGKSGGRDFGLFLLTGNPADSFKFKTPPLRNVEITGPYFHSGAVNTLEQSIRWHNNQQGEFQKMQTNPYDFVLSDSAENFVALLDLNVSHMAQRLNTVDPRVPRGVLAL